jgi:hypothetical protein
MRKIPSYHITGESKLPSHIIDVTDGRGHSPNTTEGSGTCKVGNGKDTNQGTIQDSSQCHAGSAITRKENVVEL